MTVAKIRARVAKMRKKFDPRDSYCEAGNLHAEEDELWQYVLEAIAGGAPDPAALAREALKTSSMNFERWYS